MEGLFVMAHFIAPIMPDTANKIVDYFDKFLYRSVDEFEFTDVPIRWAEFPSGYPIYKRDTILFSMLDQKAEELRTARNIAKKNAAAAKKHVVAIK
jgi:hypothetical protein